MDSDIILKDDGTAEITGDKLKASVSNIEMYYRGGHITTNNGSIEVVSDANTLKMTCSDYAMYYRGGHITTNNGSIEVISDANTLKMACSDYTMYYRGGHITTNNGSLEITSDANTLKMNCSDYAMYYRGGHITTSNGSIEVSASSIKMGTQVGEKFIGFSLAPSGMTCNVPAVSVVNPNVSKTDSQQRLALMQSASDELVVNAAQRYTGGVKVEGKVDLGGDVLTHGQLMVSVEGKLLLLQPDRISKGPGGKTQVRIPTKPINVLQAITSLQATVQELTNRLAELEARVH